MPRTWSITWDDQHHELVEADAYDRSSDPDDYTFRTRTPEGVVTVAIVPARGVRIIRLESTGAD